MTYNNLLTTQDLFMNPKLNGVLPQFGRNQPLQNVYSFAEIERRVLVYLRGVLGGTKTSDGGLTVRGKHPQVLQKTTSIAPTIEMFFNSIPSIVKGIRANTRLYTPFVSVTQLSDIKSKDQKAQVLDVIIGNIKYNPDFNQNYKYEGGADYYKEQAAWMRAVNYKMR